MYDAAAFICYDLHKMHIEVIRMAFVIRKYFYIFLFITLFFCGFVWDYFSSSNLAWFENFLYSLWFVMVSAFVDWALNSKKYKKQ